MSSLTGLRIINNFSSSDVTFENVENSGHNQEVKSQRSSAEFDAWIPWCDNAGQFKGKHMKFYTSDNKFQRAIWQRGNKIYAATTFTYSDDAPVLYDGVGLSLSFTFDGTTLTARPYGNK